MKPKLIVIGGPTASGKSDLAVRTALYFKTEIISADSRQFYREMNAGTAKPDAGRLAAVKHHFIDSLSIHDSYSAGHYQTDCLKKLDELFAKYPVVVMAGGSGLFIQAVINGFSNELPDADPELRKQLNQLTLQELQHEIKSLDPAYSSMVDLQNPRRLIRAIEIIRQTGKLYSAIIAEEKSSRCFDHLLICIDIDRNALYQRIDARVDKMLQDGLEKEAESLFEFRHLPSLKTVGYSEWFMHFEGKISKDETIQLIKQNTRRYAKRQLTWFRNRHQTFWIKPENSDTLNAKLEAFIKE